MKKFGWIITKVNTDILIIEEVGTMGPRGLTATEDEIKTQGKAFRMYDDDGILYYEGFCLCNNNEDLFMPLEHFGAPNAGCTEIHYMNQDGYWDIL